jgi:hypothetical protein
MPETIVHPINSIIVEDKGLIIEEYEAGANCTLAKMLPGTWVVFDVVAGNVKESAVTATGVIGLLMEMPTKGLTDPPAAKGDTVRVITGGYGKVLVRRVHDAGKIVPGTPLVTAADGLTALLTAGVLGAEGDVVAIGAETVSDSTIEANVVATIQLNPLSKATA